MGDKKRTDTAREMAEDVKIMVEALHDAGFNRDESLRVVCALMSGPHVHMPAMMTFGGAPETRH